MADTTDKTRIAEALARLSSAERLVFLQRLGILPDDIKIAPETRDEHAWAIVNWFDRRGRLGHLASELTAELRRLGYAPIGGPRACRVDPLPPHFVQRPTEFEKLKQLLLSPEQRTPVAITSALQGAGGFGKTTLAQALCWDLDVLAAFGADQIFWVTLGERPTLHQKLTELCGALSGGAEMFVTLKEAEDRLVALLSAPRRLLVIDDVWDFAHVRPFLGGGEGAVTRLVTTRKRAVAAEVAGTRCVPVDAMKGEEGAALLARRAEMPAEMIPRLRDLARRLGEYPLLMELTAARIRKRKTTMGVSWERALARIEEEYQRRGVTAFDAESPEERNQAVRLTIDASLAELNKAARERTCALGVFPEDVPIPLRTLGALWGMDDFDAEDVVERLCAESLVRYRDEDGGTIAIHDKIREFFETEVRSTLPALHARLLDAWGERPAPTDAYAWRFIGHHLVAAGRTDELRRRLLDYAFVEAKLRATGIAALIAEYDRLDLNGDETARLMQGALRLSAHVLGPRPEELSPQLVGRLSGFPHAALKAVVRQTATSRARPEVMPRGDCLEPPGGPLLRTIEGHTQLVTAIALHSDGRCAMSASWDQSLKLWDIDTGALLRTFEGHTDCVYAVALHSDGRRALSASWDKTLKLWDLESGALLRTLKGHTREVLAVALYPDGRRALSASVDRTLKLWDVESGELLRTLGGHTETVIAVAPHPDGRRALSASVDQTLKLWNVESGTLLRTLEGHTDGVMAVAFHSDGRRAISASNDKTLKLWDIESGTILGTLEGHTNGVNAVAFHPDGRRVISASYDKTIKLWNIESGTLLRTLEGHTEQVTAVALHPDGCRALSGSEDKTLKLWDVESAASLRAPKGHTDWVLSVAPHPDGCYALSASWDHTLKLWDIESGTLQHTMEGHTDRVEQVMLHPDGRRALSISYDSTLKIWDIESGAILHTLEEHKSFGTAVALHPDGRRAISASSDSTLKLWDIESGVLLHTLEGHTGLVSAVALYSDGCRALSASHDQTLKIWNIKSGLPLRTLKTHSSSVTSIALHPDSRRALLVAYPSSTIDLWDVESGTLLYSLEGHTDSVTTVALHPDGLRALSASYDKTIKLWDLSTGTVLCTFTGDAPMAAVAITPNGRDIIAGDKAGRVLFLRLEDPSP